MSNYIYQTDSHKEEQFSRVQRICKHYNCSTADALTYLEYKEEGHSTYQAALLAGIADPTN